VQQTYLKELIKNEQKNVVCASKIKANA